jgi:hypothetical protein
MLIRFSSITIMTGRKRKRDAKRSRSAERMRTNMKENEGEKGKGTIIVDMAHLHWSAHTTMGCAGFNISSAAVSPPIRTYLKKTVAQSR